MDSQEVNSSVLVGCPDARPPAYQAVVGLSRAGILKSFVTSSYYNPESVLPTLLRRHMPGPFARYERILMRRHDREIPASRVRPVPSFDLALRVESRLAVERPSVKRAVVRWRTERFDRALSRTIDRTSPSAVLVFSDVGSDITLPHCRARGIPAVVSMVHGDVREERRVLEQESTVSPEFLPIYLGDAAIDQAELAWLHARRLSDLAMAELVLVPSDHIARTLESHGVSPDRIRVIPYAADCRRFEPLPRSGNEADCTFLFAGGISQRKGIKYLLEAWSRVRRPGWRLQLLGPLPTNRAPLEPYLHMCEPLGRVSHSEMPALMARADVFVFPSLFEGSAVVTYEALACGLPSVVTPNAGSVVRDGLEGFVVPPRSIDDLAARMDLLGRNRELRARMGAAARARALTFDWPRYHAAVVDVFSGISRQRTERLRADLTRMTG
jgi:glycosyltransferase involved in cell wall biosynthesis